MTPQGIIALQVHATKEPVPKQIRWRNIRISERSTQQANDASLTAAWDALEQWTYAAPRQALNLIAEAVRTAEGTARTGLQSRLIQVLAGDAATVDAKRFVCRMLGVLGGDESIRALAAALPNADLSHAARQALEPLPSAEVDAALAAALAAALPATERAGIILSIGHRAQPASVATLAPHLASTDTSLRQAAIQALGSIGTAEAEDVLRRFDAAPEDEIGRAHV